MKSRFWALVFIAQNMPRLFRLACRMSLWGARSSEQIDQMLETSLFQYEWETIKAEMETFQRRHLRR
jgi:hypothetical protein